MTYNIYMVIRNKKWVIGAGVCASVGLMGWVTPVVVSHLSQDVNNTSMVQYQAQEANVSDAKEAEDVDHVGIIITSCLVPLSVFTLVLWAVCFYKRQTSSKRKNFKYKKPR